jgi:hypothetical protein
VKTRSFGGRSLFVSSVVVVVVTVVVVLFYYQSMFCVFNKSNLESIY